MDKKICPKAKECKKRCITHHNVPHIHNEECDFDNCIEWTNCGFCVTYVESSPEPSMPLIPEIDLSLNYTCFNEKALEAHDQQVRKDFAEECIKGMHILRNPYNPRIGNDHVRFDNTCAKQLKADIAHLRAMAGER